MITYEKMALATLKWGKKDTTVNNVRSMVIWFVAEPHMYPLSWTKEEEIPAHLTRFWQALDHRIYRPILAAFDNSDVPAITCEAIMASHSGEPISNIQHEVLSNWEKYATMEVLNGSR